MPWIHAEGWIFWFVFVTTFLSIALWESARPRIVLSVAGERRWRNHSVLFVIAATISTGLLRVSPVFAAVAVAHARLGLLNKPWLPFAARFIAAVLVLDLVRYSVHRSFHSFSFLWRVHRVHHSDPDLDVSTGLRVHPFEAVIMQGAYLSAVALLAPPASAVLVSEVVSLFHSFFDHANAALPPKIDQRLRSVFVTPGMHRIHHSEDVREQSRNFGDVFPWWDRLFGSYLATPATGEDRLVVGLKGFQNPASLGFSHMLGDPFRSEPQPAAPVIEERCS